MRGRMEIEWGMTEMRYVCGLAMIELEVGKLEKERCGMTCSLAFGADATATMRAHNSTGLRISLEPPFATKQSRRGLRKSSDTASDEAVICSYDQVEGHRTAHHVALLFSHQRHLATIAPCLNKHADSLLWASVRNATVQPRRLSIPIFHLAELEPHSLGNCRLVDRKVTGTTGFYLQPWPADSAALSAFRAMHSTSCRAYLHIFLLPA